MPNLPVHEFRLARIRATIWLNRNEGGESWYSVSVCRTYRDGTKWKDSQSFGRDDLPLVSKASDLAYAWIWNQSEKGGNA